MRAQTLVTAAEGALTAPPTSRDLQLWASINAAVLAYAAGDAFGVAYEFLPEPVPVDVTSIGAFAGWPYGGVSDDTLLSLLTIAAATVDDPEGSALVVPARAAPVRSAAAWARADHAGSPGPAGRAPRGRPRRRHQRRDDADRASWVWHSDPEDDLRRRSLGPSDGRGHPSRSHVYGVCRGRIQAVRRRRLGPQRRRPRPGPAGRGGRHSRPGTVIDVLRRLDEGRPPPPACH